MYDGLTNWRLTFPIYHCRSWCFMLIFREVYNKNVYSNSLCVHGFHMSIFTVSNVRSIRNPNDAPGSAFLRCAEGPAAAEGAAALSRCGGQCGGFGSATVCATPSAGDEQNQPEVLSQAVPESRSQSQWYLHDRAWDARQGLLPRAPRCRFLDLSAFSLMQSPKQEPPRNRASANERLQNP